MEVIAITDSIQKKATKAAKGTSTNAKAGKNEFSIGTSETPMIRETQAELQFKVGELERALYAKVVKKCGNRNHWEDWANDIAKIANTHISRITQIVSDPSNEKEVAAFQAFANELRDDLNDSITDAEVIEMLAQHLITKPVFDALFRDYSFASHNPVSVAMQQVLDVLHEHRLEKEADTLEKFYASVAMRAEGIESAEGKQKIVVELYDKFFRNAFPKMTERLGIVYTPVEVVDFIIHSINDLLQQEFGQTLGSKGVHIIDPFTGTGTFITRLLQSGLIKPSELPHKYKHEIHANEIVLLAYYIAAINIEAVYHSLVSKHAAATYPSPAPKGRPIPAQGNALGLDQKKNPSPEGAHYEPFQGICLTDTFQLYEKGDLISNLLTNNSDRRKRQKALDIRVIMGNPPYSKGQESANDNNQNVTYPTLDERIAETYAALSSATLQSHLYDSYIRAIRWASDRIGNCGIIGFVTNAGWVDGRAADGMRKCLVNEFSSIHIFHLRGNQRTQGEQSRKEGGKIFGSGSRAPIAISLLVKNPQAASHGQIHFHDIGDYLNTEQKLARVNKFASVNGISTAQGWTNIQPDDRGDWLRQRDTDFEKFIVMGDKKSEQSAIFENYSTGVATGRDTWCYNFSRSSLEENIRRTVDFYNAELERFNAAHVEADRAGRESAAETFPIADSTCISWTRALRADLAKSRSLPHVDGASRKSVYRPFTKQWLHFDRRLSEILSQMPRIFPHEDTVNFVIVLKIRPAADSQLALMVREPVERQSDGGTQCFPLYLYEQVDDMPFSDDLFPAPEGELGMLHRRDAITDVGLAHFQQAYPAAGEGGTITKEDLFYYIYGLLHSPDYRSRYADNLGKELPRIPAVKTFSDFMAFSKAGRELAHWHLNYETVACHPGVTVQVGKEEGPYCPSSAKEATVRSPLLSLTAESFRVTKMKFAKKKDPETGKSVNDKTTVIYNDFITLRNIPLSAYDYVVNGKPALEWVMERQSVTTDKDSGITNDANLWATETMGNARYPLELFLRVVTVSLETNRIVAGLPGLDISVESSS
jgi:predicted helicase